jgi:hypothetical protein
MARPKVVVFVALLAFALTGCPGQTGAFDEWRMRNDTDEIIYVSGSMTARKSGSARSPRIGSSRCQSGIRTSAAAES